MLYTLGLDFGTSGARAIAINSDRNIILSDRYPFPSIIANHPHLWHTALFSLLDQLPIEIAQSLGAIAINGTSGTIVICDRNGNPQSPTILYNDSCRPSDAFLTSQGFNSPTLPVPPTLLKLLWWAEQSGWSGPPSNQILLHQADWLAGQLHGQMGLSDYHNALKLGYDPGLGQYLPALQASPWATMLPRILAPGTPIATVTPAIAQRFGINPACQVCAGTTDSIAAFLAAGVTQPGEAVTSLGSTLVLKLLSRTRVDEPKYGIYSHRLGDLWLVGGASNSGGAVLRHYFSDDELRSLSLQINPDQPSPLDYYPLLKPGDRFPIADPNLPPRLSPRPISNVEFLHGLLDGIAGIETLGYQRLQESGATPLTQVWSAGGGAHNPTWSTIRQRRLGVPVAIAPQTEAAVGTACLAATGLGDGRYSNF